MILTTRSKGFITDLSQTEDWDGVSELKPNHRVKGGVIMSFNRKRDVVCVMEEDGELDLLMVNGIEPVKPSIKCLRDKWWSIPKAAPPLLSNEEDFVQWLIDNGHVKRT